MAEPAPPPRARLARRFRFVVSPERRDWAVAGPALAVSFWTEGDMAPGRPVRCGLVQHWPHPRGGSAEPDEACCWALGGPCWGEDSWLRDLAVLPPLLRTAIEMDDHAVVWGPLERLHAIAVGA